jgi:hypothetical protein
VVTDPDANAYILAVEAADGQTLETAVRAAINDFVIGCKADGIWTAIKASCILAGARTLNGCLVPLVGAAPTNFNFAAGDYNRKTGLVGNASTKYLLANRNENSDPQNSRHFGCYASAFDTISGPKVFMAARTTASAGPAYMDFNNLTNFRYINNSGTIVKGPPSAGFLATSRSNSTEVSGRLNGITFVDSSNLQPPGSAPFTIFARDSGASGFSAHRLAFYSIGESLDLALLDARVTTLINAFAAAIP